jgi:hypothetical protein
LLFLSGEATNNNVIVFGLTQSHTQGEHANNYTTDAVCRFEK